MILFAIVVVTAMLSITVAGIYGIYSRRDNFRMFLYRKQLKKISEIVAFDPNKMQEDDIRLAIWEIQQTLIGNIPPGER